IGGCGPLKSVAGRTQPNGRGAWMIPLTRTVGVSTDREPVSECFLNAPRLSSSARSSDFDNSEGEARRRRGLGQMSRTHSLLRDAGAKNRPPKGAGRPGLGSLDKDWCRHERDSMTANHVEHGIATFPG